MLVDGIFYGSNDTVPDLGSWRCSGADVSGITGRQIRVYYGLSSDVSKLPTVATAPKYDGILGSGSIAICTDSGATYMYEQTTDTWTAQ